MGIISWGHSGLCYPQWNPVRRWCRGDLSRETATTNSTDSRPTNLMESTLTPLSAVQRMGTTSDSRQR